MDATVRVWNLQTGQCQYALTGHTSLVGLLGLSPSHLVSAAADSTLRIWDPDTGELRHTLAAHTGAITCFQHDEFKVLSGSDGNLKMWNVRDGTVVRDLLTGITGVWQVVFEGRWCVAASNRNDATVLDVWDFGNEDDEDWLGEPPGGLYDEDIFSDDGYEDDFDMKTRNLSGMEDEYDEQEQADIDAMDQDLVASESDSVVEIEFDESGQEIQQPRGDVNVEISDSLGSEGVDASRWAPASAVTLPVTPSRPSQPPPGKAGGAGPSRGLPFEAAGPSLSSMAATARLPSNDETPTRPRIRNHGNRRR
jgi:F-box and WD-40 domain protein CDC4